MNVDNEDGTVTEQPADDIRSVLDAAVAEAEAPVADAAAAATVAPKAEVDGAAATEDGRVRGPDGKFVKKEEAAAVADAGKTAAKTVAQDPAAAAAAPATDSKDAPAHWSAADKATFTAQPPAAQAFILDRVKAMEGDYTKKTQAIAALKNEYGPVDEMFAPHRDVLRQKGFSPRTLIEAWANVETKLAAGPDSAIDVIRGLVQGYNIPVERIAAALGLTKAQAAAAANQQQQPGQQQPTAIENGQPVALPPEVARELQQLREQVGTFGQKFQTIEQREASNRRAVEIQQEQAAENTVNEFRNSKDDKGNLLHPHMEEVEGMMTALANAALASKQPVPSLKELYETAVYANPSTREKVLTAIRLQEETTRTEAARAKAAAARKAGSSVNGAPGPGQAPSGKSSDGLSLREQLEAAADDAA
jgi:hypothetical protein